MIKIINSPTGHDPNQGSHRLSSNKGKAQAIVDYVDIGIRRKARSVVTTRVASCPAKLIKRRRKQQSPGVELIDDTTCSKYSGLNIYSNLSAAQFP